MKSDREIKLERAMGHLIKRYWMNKGTDSEFIQVLTTKGIPDFWRAAANALREHPYVCQRSDCDNDAIVGVGDRWLCKKHMDMEFRRIGDFIKTLRGLTGVKE